MIKTLLFVFLAGLLTSVAATRYLAWRVEANFPPAGKFMSIDNTLLHYLDTGSQTDNELAPLIFIHGASGNARDLHGAFAGELAGRARMIFVDRPGAGYSQRGSGNKASPQEQARLVARLLDSLNIEKAIIVGHSLGGAVAAAMAVNHNKKMAGLILLAPAVYQWPGGAISWYFQLADKALLGWLFSETIAVPLGHLLYHRVVREVFRPDRVPQDYESRSGTRLVLRPRSFRHNAADVAALYDSLADLAQRYDEIDVPTTIIAGKNDRVVSARIHAIPLHDAIGHSRLVILPEAGHMPSYTHTDWIVREIERISRRLPPRDGGRIEQMSDT
jgi:pimeloyl-ACP methyl ester carboxylesterase